MSDVCNKSAPELLARDSAQSTGVALQSCWALGPQQHAALRAKSVREKLIAKTAEIWKIK